MSRTLRSCDIASKFRILQEEGAKMHDFIWDDIRHFLEVVKCGSVCEAADSLRVNQTTVSRRITALETKLGVSLFDRNGKGWVVTPAGESILNDSERMAEQANAIQRQVYAGNKVLAGKLRVTAPDACTQRMLIPGISAFLVRHPTIDLELITTDNELDLGAREADVAFRGTDNPPENVVGKRIGRAEYAVYGNQYWLDKITAGDTKNLAAITWIGDGSTKPQWIQKSFPGTSKVYRVNSVGAMIDLVKHGVGIAQFGCILGDVEPALYRIPARYVEEGVDLWVLSHTDLRTTARVRVFRDFMVTELGKQLDLLEGRMEGAGRDRRVLDANGDLSVLAPLQESPCLRTLSSSN
jgi:DNA-binding transcriptional LysR family regulator